MRLRPTFAFTLKIHDHSLETIAVSIRLSDSKTITILEEQKESDERSFGENVWTWAVCKSKKRELLITLYCFRLFVLWVPLCEERKHNVTKPEDILTDTPTSLCILQV